MERQFGFEVGSSILAEHHNNGVQTYMSRKVVEVKGSGNLATHVILDDGTKLEADLVIVGAGVKPSTGFLNNSGIKLD